MAGRCGCAGTCACVLQAGTGITVTGAGTPVSPWVVSMTGFSDCGDVMDCVGANLGGGLDFNPTTGDVSLRYSSDAGNVAGPGSDGGVFVPAPGAPGANPVITGSTSEVVMSGDGTAGAPVKGTLTGLLDGGKSWLVPGGDVTIGDPAVATQRAFKSTFNGGAGEVHSSWLNPGGANYSTVLTSIRTQSDGAEIERAALYLGSSGLLQVRSGTPYTLRPVPFAMAQGTVAATFNNSTVASNIAVTYPVNRFTITTGGVWPLVYLSIQSGAGIAGTSYMPRAHTFSTSGFQISVNSSGPITGTYSIAWLAIQMTPSAVAAVALADAAPAEDDLAPLHTVICDTPGCEAAGVPIEIPVPDPEAVWCGTCSQRITQVVATQT